MPNLPLQKQFPNPPVCFSILVQDLRFPHPQRVQSAEGSSGDTLMLLPAITALTQRWEAKGEMHELGKLIKITEISRIRTQSCVTAAFGGI